MLSDRELLTAVQRELAEGYVVYGELGRNVEAVALLGFAKARSQLVVLMVESGLSVDGETELAVEVRDELDSSVPDGGTTCPACRHELRPWIRFCTNCGFDVAGSTGGRSSANKEMLRAAVQEAVDAEYELLGEIPRKEGGGDVYFARERESGRIAALRLTQGAESGEFDLTETHILKAKGASAALQPMVMVSQIVRALDPNTPVPGHAFFTQSWRTQIAVAKTLSKKSLTVPVSAVVMAGAAVLVALLFAIVLSAR